MFNCLKCFNFGPDIIKKVKCFYNDVKSSVTNSGYMTEFFSYRKGFKAGMSTICLPIYNMYRTTCRNSERK